MIDKNVLIWEVKFEKNGIFKRINNAKIAENIIYEVILSC